MIRTYLLNISELENIKYDESLFGERRRDIISRLKFENDKKLAAAAELLLIYSIKQLVPDALLPFEIQQDNKGKPVFLNKFPTESFSDEKYRKLFKEGTIYFNLSHSHEYAVCSVSNEPVGVDIEYIKRAEIQHPEKILHEKEAETLAFITNPLEKKKYFFECWTLKESYLKNLGIGIVVRSSEFMIEEDRLVASNKKLKSRYAHCMNPGEIIGTDWKFDVNYRLSYCISKKDPDIITKELKSDDINSVLS